MTKYNVEAFKGLIESLDVTRGDFFKNLYMRTFINYVNNMSIEEAKEFADSDAIYYFCNHFFNNRKHFEYFCQDYMLQQDFNNLPNVVKESLKVNLTKCILDMKGKVKLRNILNFLINGTTVTYSSVFSTFISQQPILKFIDEDLILNSDNKLIKTILMEIKLGKK